MGNRLQGRRRVRVEEEYTKPQGVIYQAYSVDYKKLRKLILSGKLAPCFPGKDIDEAPDLEECPICFYYYPSLNRSRCCRKSICTECFLQMKPQSASLPTQCPFCKTCGYAVQYRGAMTKEEKGRELIEEQKVMEAKVRMQNCELINSTPQDPAPTATQINNDGHGGSCDISETSIIDERSSKHDSNSPSEISRLSWNSTSGSDIEEIMMMHAIILSLQACILKSTPHASVDHRNNSTELHNMPSMLNRTSPTLMSEDGDI